MITHAITYQFNRVKQICQIACKSNVGCKHILVRNVITVRTSLKLDHKNEQRPEAKSSAKTVCIPLIACVRIVPIFRIFKANKLSVAYLIYLEYKTNTEI